MQDIIKAVSFNHGIVENDRGEKKFKTVISMVVLSDEPIFKKDAVIMGTCSISRQLADMPKYEFPYVEANMMQALVAVSELAPDDLEPLER